jgi:cation diffusion facilitator CzcD-associated flavoprotein CzcO
MPNLFLFLGPNGGPGAGSFIAMLELVVEYVAKCARKMQLEHISSMEVAYGLYSPLESGEALKLT